MDALRRGRFWVDCITIAFGFEPQAAFGIVSIHISGAAEESDAMGKPDSESGRELGRDCNCVTREGARRTFFRTGNTRSTESPSSNKEAS
jgi:hypothetical protein